ncbi:hypothetical protein BDY24DRAFT_374131 [Mrakia frigida]|uniref:uncharacterized protein n=1 Tax=Mrakia frigida TaxID=29902 RepID=UPI003FCC12EF
MPPVGKLAGLSPEEKLDFQRERNRRKSAALRARKKEELKKEKTEEEGESSATGPGEQSLGEDEKDTIIRKLVARLSELGEREDEINRLVEGENREESSSLLDVVQPFRMLPSSPKLEASPEVWYMDRDSSPRSKAASIPTAGERNCLSLFGSLMNGSSSVLSSAPRPEFQLTQLSHLSFPSINVDKIRLALNLSAAYPHVPPQHLPTYSYCSFASSLHDYPSWIRTGDDTLEWKWRLFEFHRVSHQNRHHPSDGYLSNPQIDAIVASAQLLILKLVASTSTLDRKAIFDARRPLPNQADRDYLRLEEIDPRIHYIPGPRARLRTSQLTSGGPPNFMHLTEQIGQGLEISVIHGDYWDLTSWSGPNSSPLPLSTSQYSSYTDTDRTHSQLIQSRGALIREIVLGLEQPGWRVPPPPAYLPSTFEQACVQEEPPIWTHWEADHRVRTMRA